MRGILRGVRRARGTSARPYRLGERDGYIAATAARRTEKNAGGLFRISGMIYRGAESGAMVGRRGFRG